MENKRSTGIIIVACIFLIYAVFSACEMLILTKGQLWSKENLFSVIFVSITSLTAIFTGLGLWGLKEWARKLALFFVTLIILIPNFFMIIEKVSAILKNQPFVEWFGLGMMLVQLGVAILLWWFFTRPIVKGQFNH